MCDNENLAEKAVADRTVIERDVTVEVPPEVYQEVVDEFLEHQRLAMERGQSREYCATLEEFLNDRLRLTIEFELPDE